MKKKEELQDINNSGHDTDIVEQRKITKTKKIIIRMFFILIVLLLIIIAPIFFYKKELNQNLLSPHYKKGAFHIHSTFSDGTGNVEEISKAAKAAKLDFIVMTDHGRPNVKCSQSTGWIDGVLVVGGSEFSLNCGHLACAGFGFVKKPDYFFPPEPQEAIDDVNKVGGISFISHPLDKKIPWTAMEVNGFSGIEIFNSYSSATKTSIFNLIKFPLQYLFSKNYALLNTLSFPVDNMKLWDDFNKKGDYFGIYALDAHSKLPITKKIVFKWPSYKAMFKIFTVYVKTDKGFDRNPEYSADLLISAMKKGRFFSVIEAVASANGFETVFIGENGRKFDLGSRIENMKGDILVKLPFVFKTDVIVKRDGKIFKEVRENIKKELKIKIDKPGTYRLEVFVSENTFDDLPWILTNPFFIGKKKREEKKVFIPEIKEVFVIDEYAFGLEKNKNSDASMQLLKTDAETVMSLDYTLNKDEGNRNFWIALGHRKVLDLSAFSGILFKARADTERRFWFEIRTGNEKQALAYRHTFLPGKDWKQIRIPFNDLVFVQGKYKKLDLSKISSIFFTINNSLSYKGVSGTLKLKDIGFY